MAAPESRFRDIQRRAVSRPRFAIREIRFVSMDVGTSISKFSLAVEDLNSRSWQPKLLRTKAAPGGDCDDARDSTRYVALREKSVNHAVGVGVAAQNLSRIAYSITACIERVRKIHSFELRAGEAKPVEGTRCAPTISRSSVMPLASPHVSPRQVMVSRYTF